MNHTPHLSRRALLGSAAAAAVIAVVGRAGTGSAAPAAIGDIVATGGAVAAQPAKRLRGNGKVLFPMQTTPRCAILSNYNDARSGGRLHEGIDILSTLGQEVYAPSAGKLTVQYVDGGVNASLSGNAWGLEGEDGNYYFFAHLSRFADGLAVGSTVTKAQLIGYVGDTGNPGPGNYHLHFEIHPGGMKKAAVDPLTLLDVPKACSIT